jgi:integrase/recombinase XerD
MTAALSQREDSTLARIERRARQAGLPHTTCCHTFRATGSTTCLPKVLFRGQNGGTIEHAQPIGGRWLQIANHESPRTLARLPTAGRATKLYDRTSNAIGLDEIERIRI